ncbi:MAG: ABC transporter ATP-binding protein [Rhodospirillum sp.]|nr:ABC transporter ATP-binding protein [Rhodospirillum sp.]MCF8489327.1 ABC transporter ATP-binding protein [Rhodospirillum sp.]MCF8503227.1 ABC transporter ATP-binding protein [Rhodospirillum sp.]
MSIRFEGVTHLYPGSDLGVRDLTLELSSGELMAVIGPSGSGKTTALGLLAGFLKPQAGRVLIDGEDVTDQPARDRNLGIVFQSHALFPHMTCGANVAYPLKVRGVSRGERETRAREALDAVGLGGYADRRVATLSGGQSQRVALARALVFRPRALLLDEPLSALDAGLRVSMREEIRRVQRDFGITTLHVTHDQEEALSMADRVAVLRDGGLRQVAPPLELYDHPVDREVAAFVGEANLIDGEVRAPGRVRTALGILACETSGWDIGAPVTLFFRPEAVRAVDPGEVVSNLLPGAVTRDRFMGSVRRYDFAAAGGSVLGETRSRDGIAAVALPPECIRLLPREAASIIKTTERTES